MKNFARWICLGLVGFSATLFASSDEGLNFEDARAAWTAELEQRTPGLQQAFLKIWNDRGFATPLRTRADKAYGGLLGTPQWDKATFFGQPKIYGGTTPWEQFPYIKFSQIMGVPLANGQLALITVNFEARWTELGVVTHGVESYSYSLDPGVYRRESETYITKRISHWEAQQAIDYGSLQLKRLIAAMEKRSIDREIIAALNNAQIKALGHHPSFEEGIRLNWFIVYADVNPDLKNSKVVLLINVKKGSESLGVFESEFFYGDTGKVESRTTKKYDFCRSVEFGV